MIWLFVFIALLPWLVFAGFVMFCRDAGFRRWLERGYRERLMCLMHLFLLLLGVLISGGMWLVLAGLSYLGSI